MNVWHSMLHDRVTCLWCHASHVVMLQCDQKWIVTVGLAMAVVTGTELVCVGNTCGGVCFFLLAGSILTPQFFFQSFCASCTPISGPEQIRHSTNHCIELVPCIGVWIEWRLHLQRWIVQQWQRFGDYIWPWQKLVSKMCIFVVVHFVRE